MSTTRVNSLSLCFQEVLTAILRVADALDRTHHRVVKDLRVNVSRKEVELVVTAVLVEPSTSARLDTPGE